MKSLLKLIELLCENNTGQFQDLCREQNIIQNNAVSINLVAEIRSLLVSFTGYEEIKRLMRMSSLPISESSI